MDFQIKMYPEMSDGDLAELYQTAESEKLFDHVCYDWPMSEAVFSLAVRRAEVFAAVYDGEGQPLAFFYLTDFQGLSAHVHMGFFKRGRSRRHEVGRMVLNWCFETFAFQCLVGLIPVINRAAAWYAGELEGERLGKIPGCCWIERLRQSVDGIMFIFERK